ncbi:insulinase family protein, partial [bacterium]|nr:insulinase family protein [bacterium]
MKQLNPLLKGFIIMCLTFAFTAPAISGDFEPGKTYHGFKLLEKKHVKEANAEGLLFEHEQSGARLLKLKSKDDNKWFGITFKTTPETDCGTPHIMEHSVLNGSRKFPVKSPFDVLAKGSLNTFLNAMTASDWTMYPVASKNTKDYFNLVDVYLDAVLFPKIYDDPRIFKQEGWHHELMAEDAPATYKGVVYNEMKGAFSDPTQEMFYEIDKNLFPETCYGKSSGGYPATIPQLTYDAFLNFHKRFYHPSNSYIFLYGDADLNTELAFINDEYLSKFKNSGFHARIATQKPFDSLKRMTGYYPVAADADTTDQTFLTMSIVAGEGKDQALVMALDILTDVLVNQESAPIRRALQGAGIGKDVSAYKTDVKQNVFQIIVKNANPADQAKFEEIVFNTLRETVKNGIDKKTLEGTLNRTEFRLR